jgi:hypothetical protein
MVVTIDKVKNVVINIDDVKPPIYQLTNKEIF